MYCALDHCRSRSPVPLVRYGSAIVANRRARGLRRRVGILPLGDTRKPILLLDRPDTTRTRAPGRHRWPLSLGAPSRVCRRDPRTPGERDRPLLMARHGARRPRRAAPPLANHHRGPHLARPIARLHRICRTGALAIASRCLVKAAATRRGQSARRDWYQAATAVLTLDVTSCGEDPRRLLDRCSPLASSESRMKDASFRYSAGA